MEQNFHRKNVTTPMTFSLLFYYQAFNCNQSLNMRHYENLLNRSLRKKIGILDQPLTIITKRSILDVAAALDPPLQFLVKTSQ